MFRTVVSVLPRLTLACQWARSASALPSRADAAAAAAALAGQSEAGKEAAGESAPPTGNNVLRLSAEEFAALPEPVQRALSLENGTQEDRNELRRQAALRQFQRHLLDTGSAEVQVALLTERMACLTRHLQQHRKDMRTKRAVEMLSAQRRKLLRYLFRTRPDRFTTVTAHLGIRAGSLQEAGGRHGRGAKMGNTGAAKGGA
ncbi:hypothetical protein CDCA_CDCA12G3511 [Cyanidium caldarium]|uniref:30S ribosomal protein S15 n=1 Tax=Cyanidium caldarium TaxID=2771 RepID=A0AAV9IZD2_CYACA|nr:hypothetical protein CDCA_CDCA12G3511 [Cyanidium caldarium]